MQFVEGSRKATPMYISSLLRIGVVFLFLCILDSCGQEQKPKAPGTAGGPVITDTVAVAYISKKDSLVRKQRLSAYESSDFSGIHCEAVYDSTTEWGYDVYAGKKLVISQRTIPGMPGVKGFKTKVDAYKTGNHVAYKLINNIFPPSISKEELDSLKVNY